MRLFFIITLLMFLVGCGTKMSTTTTAEIPQIGPKEVYTKRIYLMHGLRSTKEDFTNPPFKAWITDLKEKGYEVITFNLPYASESYFDTDGGLQYRETFIELMSMVVEQTESKLGPAKTNIVGGVSWGGLHSLMAVELLPGMFDQYFSYVPVTDLTALVEFESCCTSTLFNPWETPERLSEVPGYIAWGNMDYRVDYTLTINLVENIDDKSMLTTKEWNLGHQSTPESLQAITNWLEER